jgi:MYXO-CTERM domain-containing protein
LFARSETGWSEERRFVEQAGAAFDGFGWSVALAPKLALVGAMGVDVGANDEQGVVWSFARASVDGDACAMNGDCASLHCAEGICCDVECTGACAACSVAAGAQVDGVCTISPAGAEGSPACAPLTCNGVALDCAPCVHDGECASGKYCAADGGCQAQRATLAACVPEADCREPGCRLCAVGQCAEGACRDCLEDSACTTGNYCSADGTCKPRPPKPAATSDGCGCRAAPSAPSPYAAWVLASSLLLMGLRRRRAAA